MYIIATCGTITGWLLSEVLLKNCSNLIFFLLPRTRSSADVAVRYHSVDWTPSKVSALQSLFEHAPISMQCNTSSGVRFPVSEVIKCYTSNRIHTKSHRFIGVNWTFLLTSGRLEQQTRSQDSPPTQLGAQKMYKRYTMVWINKLSLTLVVMLFSVKLL